MIDLNLNSDYADREIPDNPLMPAIYLMNPKDPCRGRWFSLPVYNVEDEIIKSLKIKHELLAVGDYDLPCDMEIHSTTRLVDPEDDNCKLLVKAISRTKLTTLNQILAAFEREQIKNVLDLYRYLFDHASLTAGLVKFYPYESDEALDQLCGRGYPSAIFNQIDWDHFDVKGDFLYYNQDHLLATISKREYYRYLHRYAGRMVSAFRHQQGITK